MPKPPLKVPQRRPCWLCFLNLYLEDCYVCNGSGWLLPRNNLMDRAIEKHNTVYVRNPDWNRKPKEQSRGKGMPDVWEDS